MKSDCIIEKLSGVSSERVREEMRKCFEYDTLKIIKVLEEYPKNK